MAAGRRYGGAIWGALLGVAALVALARLVHVGEALAAMRGLRLSVTVLALPYAAATALAALPWGVLLGGSRPRWAAVVAGRFAASAVNVVVPTGVVGEPLRLRSVGVSHRARAGEALVWDRALYLAASGAFVATCALLAPGGAAYRAAALGATAAYGAVAASLVGVLQVRPLRRIAGERLARWLPAAQQAAALRPTWGAGLSGFGLHLAARSLSALEIALAAYLLHAPLSLEAWALAAGALALTGAAFPWVPGQIGVQEAALTGALAAMEFEPTTALAVSLLLRLRQLVFVPLGLALVFVRPAADAAADADGAAT